MKSIEKIYDDLLDRPYLMLAISLSLLAVFGSIIAYHYISSGDLFEKGLDFSGGTQIVLITKNDFDLNKIAHILQQQFGDVVVKKGKSSENYLLIVESGTQLSKDDVVKAVSNAGLEVIDTSVYSISPAVSSAFWKQAIKVFLIAFIGMAIVVFLTFRVFVPSVAIILAAISDIITAVALMDVFKIKMTLATFAALLILLGYSVDTDILLSSRVLKRGDATVKERIKSSAKTGITMTTTSILAMLALHFITPADVLKNLSAIIVFGLCADIPFTWLQNVSILKIYIDRGGKR